MYPLYIGGLYIGYPQPLVLKWLRDNINQRWIQRFRNRSDESDPVLVLKSHYNTAWDNFNAQEIQNRMFEYWREWVQRATRGDYSIEFPICDKPDSEAFSYSHGHNKVEVKLPGGDTIWVPNIINTDILNRRVLVSKRRNRQMKDLVNLWNKSILKNVEEDEALDPLPPSSRVISLQTGPMEIDTVDPDEAPRSYSENLQLFRSQSSSPGVGKGWFGS